MTYGNSFAPGPASLQVGIGGITVGIQPQSISLPQFSFQYQMPQPPSWQPPSWQPLQSQQIPLTQQEHQDDSNSDDSSGDTDDGSKATETDTPDGNSGDEDTGQYVFLNELFDLFVESDIY